MSSTEVMGVGCVGGRAFGVASLLNVTLKLFLEFLFA